MLLTNTRLSFFCASIILLCAVQDVTAQSFVGSSEPICVSDCVSSAASDNNCSDPTDTSCICDSAFLASYNTCLKNTCNASDQSQGQSLQSSVCGSDSGSDSSSSSGSSTDSSSSKSGSSSSQGSNSGNEINKPAPPNPDAPARQVPPKNSATDIDIGSVVLLTSMGWLAAAILVV